MTSAAAMVGCWSRQKWRFGPGINVPGPMSAAASLPSPGPADPIGLTVEIFVNSAWTDISTYVYYRDLIQISRGRSDETSQPQPQTCTFTVNNRDGRFSPRNPMGMYYGQIGRNTPVRVSRFQNGVRRYRFYGEVSAWPTTWDQSGTDVYAQVTAAGPLRRLNQGTAVLGSAMKRAYVLGESNLFVPIAYWPCEDGATATQLASGLPGGVPMTVTGSPKYATDSTFICSLPLPVLNGSTWSGSVPAYTMGTDNVLRFLLFVPAAGEADQTLIARMYTTGTVKRVDLLYGTNGAGSFELAGFDSAGNQLFSTNYVSFSLNGLVLRVGMALQASGPNIIYHIDAVVPGATQGGFSGTLSSATVGTVTQVVINPGGGLTNTVIGHVSYQSTYDVLTDLSQQLNAWLAENPADRFERLCREQDVPEAVVSYDQFGNDVTLGYQLSDTFPNLIQQIADADLSFLYETIDQFGLGLRTRLSLYNQGTTYNNEPPELNLDYSQSQLSGPLNPLDDDQLTRNDVIVTRIGGSSAQQTQTSGALNIAEPPVGVGDYQTTYDISVGSDGSLNDHAGWRLHMGTVDEPRYPQLSLNLRHSQFTNNVTLMNQALTIDIGSRITIANPPPWMPTDMITQVVQGYTESMGVWEHNLVLVSSPEDPYHVAVLDDTVLSAADTDGSTLAAPVSATATTLLVATTNSTSPLWTTSAGDFPFDISVAGERMTVTNIAGSSSPQTFTVTRSVNAVVKSQVANTDIRLWQPMILSL